jgi:3-dehydroquinate synthetase
LLESLGERLLGLGIERTTYIITDSNVMNPYARQVQRALQRDGIPAHCFIIPAGEPSKSFELAQAIYDWLANLRAEEATP